MVLAMVFRHKRTGQLAVARMETTAIDLAHSEAHAWFLAGDPKAIVNNAGLFNTFFNDRAAWETAKLAPLALPETTPEPAAPTFVEPISSYDNTVGGDVAPDGPVFDRRTYR